MVRLYAPLVASWCRKWGVAEQDIGDVLQDTFSAVANHLNRFHKDRPGDTFRGWLATIARNKARDHFRRRADGPAAVGGTEATLHLQQIAGADGIDSGPDVVEEMLVNEVLRAALESIRGEFHDRTWQAFWYVVVEGRATDVVAADLGMKPGAVRVAKSRVLRQLRETLGDLS
jgi:RNA polymerase sigma-70 factor (ECF subfamily)